MRLEVSGCDAESERAEGEVLAAPDPGPVFSRLTLEPLVRVRVVDGWRGDRLPLAVDDLEVEDARRLEMEKKGQLTSDQLREVDSYLGKLVHGEEVLQGRAEESVEVCPTCQQPIAKPDGVTHSMLIVTGKTTGVYLSVADGQVLVVGRGKNCDVRLEDGEASRKHAEIRGQERFCIVRDQGSANGTFVNGKRVESKQLSDGDVVLIGGTRIIFYLHKD